MTDFTVGQKVILIEGYGHREAIEVEVTKVGRTLVHIHRYGHSLAFYKDTGEGRRSANAGGDGDRIYTLEQWAERERRIEATTRLRGLYIAPVGYGGFHYDTDTLERLIAVLEEAEEI